MSILIIGDLHIKASNERQISIASNDIMETILNNNIAFVVILGDTLDNMGKIDMECLCRAADLFELIASTGKHLFVLIGNHDRKNNREYLTNRHPFRGFDKYPGISIVSTVGIFNFPMKNLGIESNEIKTFCFVPYVPNGMCERALKEFNINISDIHTFFSHGEYDGCDISKLSKKAWEVWPENYPLNISGHVHNHQVVQNNLIYVGTPFQHDFTEPPNKGIYLLDLLSSEVKLTKIQLKIPPKIEIKVRYTDLQNLVIDPNTETRLRIYGPVSYVKEIMNRSDMIAKFANVSKKYEEESKDKKVIKRSDNLARDHNMLFYNSLIEQVNKDERMKFVYSTLFPNR